MNTMECNTKEDIGPLFIDCYPSLFIVSSVLEQI